MILNPSLSCFSIGRRWARNSQAEILISADLEVITVLGFGWASIHSNSSYAGTVWLALGLKPADPGYLLQPAGRGAKVQDWLHVSKGAKVLTNGSAKAAQLQMASLS